MKCDSMVGSLRGVAKILEFHWSKKLISALIFKSKWCHPSPDDYAETIYDIEKQFFAFNCQQKNLIREILIIWFAISVRANLFFLLSAGNSNFLCCFILILWLSIHFNVATYLKGLYRLERFFQRLISFYSFMAI